MFEGLDVAGRHTYVAGRLELFRLSANVVAWGCFRRSSVIVSRNACFVMRPFSWIRSISADLPHVGGGQRVEGHEVSGVEGFSHAAPSLYWQMSRNCMLSSC